MTAEPEWTYHVSEIHMLTELRNARGVWEPQARIIVKSIYVIAGSGTPALCPRCSHGARPLRVHATCRDSRGRRQAVRSHLSAGSLETAPSMVLNVMRWGLCWSLTVTSELALQSW